MTGETDLTEIKASDQRGCEANLEVSIASLLIDLIVALLKNDRKWLLY